MPIREQGGLYGTRKPSNKENVIIKLAAEGLSAKEIGEKIGISAHVVKNRLCVIYDKLGVWNRVELTLWYLLHQRIEV
jgi:two-component system nitrate/nitrite response regulator NarL